MLFHSENRHYRPLADLLAARQAVVFCGAGISLEPPAGLPDWHKLRDSTLAAIAGREPFLAPYLAYLTEKEMIAAPGQQGLTPEYVASVILAHCQGYFESFRALEQGQANANHRYLAKIVRAGYLQYIITTNFDTFIEQALVQENLDFRVYRTDQDFSQFQLSLPSVHLLKLHGCIDLPATITATVEQEGVGLSPAKLQALHHLLKQYHFIFWGYSGADLKLSLDYLHLVTMQSQAPGLIWNFLERNGRKEPVNPQVAEIARLYGSKARIVYGKLPEVFDALLADPDRIVRERYSSEQEEELRLAKNRKLQQALGAWAEANIEKTVALAIFARLLQYNGQIDQAVVCYTKLLAEAIVPSDHELIANACNELGYIYKLRGEYCTALDYFQRAEALAREYGESRLLAVYLNSIAGIYRVWRRYDSALRLYQEAERIARMLGDDKGLAMYLNKLGGIYRTQGDWVQALRYLRQAEALTRSLGDQQGLAINLDNIGKIYRDRRDFGKALEYLKEAEKITRALGDKQGLAVRLSSIAGVYKRNPRTRNKAIAYYRQAEQIAQELGDRRGMLLHTRNIAGVYRSQHANRDAINYYLKALAIAKAMPDIKNSANIARSIAEIYHQRLGQPEQAIAYYQQSLNAYQELGWHREIVALEKMLRQLLAK